jgi:hypothetical protein
VTIYSCAGLLVSSPLELAAPQAGALPIGSAADVEIVEGDVRPVPNQRPSEDVVAERIVDGVAWYTFARCGDVVVARFYGLGDFEIASSAGESRTRSVTFYRAPTTPIGFIAILLAGTIIAYLLCADGNLVLHASAVEVEGTALAFIGQSGQGKTTMATLLCAAGYPLVADDLLPVELQGDDVMCVPVGTELRVREKVETLLERFDSRTTRRLTVDERHAVAPQTTGAKKLPLTAIVVPWPDREVGEVTARRLAAGDAAVTLARCQRVEGWSSPSMLRTQFEAISTVVRSVPVLVMRVPWGPPFRDSLANAVLSASGHGPTVVTSLADG